MQRMSKDSPLAYHGSNLLLFLVGFNVKNYHQDRLPVFLAQTPSGTSLHNFIHLSQMIDSGAMQKWNYWSGASFLYACCTPCELDDSFLISVIRT